MDACNGIVVILIASVYKDIQALDQLMRIGVSKVEHELHSKHPCRPEVSRGIVTLESHFLPVLRLPLEGKRVKSLFPEQLELINMARVGFREFLLFKLLKFI